MTTKIRFLRKTIGESFVIWVVIGYFYRIIGIAILALVNNRANFMRPVGYAIIGGAAVGLVWAFPHPRAHSLLRRIASIGYIIGAISAGIYSLDRWVFPPRTYWPSGVGTLVCLGVWLFAMHRWGKKRDFKPFMDHDILNVEDLGEDWDGEGTAFRKVRVQVLHKHGNTTYMTTDEEVMPKDAQTFVIRTDHDDDDD